MRAQTYARYDILILILRRACARFVSSAFDAIMAPASFEHSAITHIFARTVTMFMRYAHALAIMPTCAQMPAAMIYEPAPSIRRCAVRECSARPPLYAMPRARTRKLDCRVLSVKMAICRAPAACGTRVRDAQHYGARGVRAV